MGAFDGWMRRWRGQRPATPDDGGSYVTPRSRKASPVFKRFADLLPYIGQDEESRLFVVEGPEPDTVESIGFVLELNPQTGASAQMADYLTTLFTCDAPVGTGMQFHLLGTPDIEAFLDAYEATAVPSEAFASGTPRHAQAELFRTLIEKRKAYYRNGATSGLFGDMHYRMRDFRLVMSVAVPVAKSMTGAFPKLDAFLASDDMRETFGTVSVLRETVITTLKSYFLFSREYTADDLIDWCATLLNIQRTIAGDRFAHKYDDTRPLRHQIVAPETAIREDAQSLSFSDGRYPTIGMRAMSVRSYPKTFLLPQMGNLIGSAENTTLSYPCPFLITMGVQFLDYDAQRNTTIVKAARATQGAESPMAKFQPDLIDRGHDWAIALAAFEEDGGGHVKLFHQLLLFAPPDELGRCEQAARGIWRAQNIDLTVDVCMQKQALLASLPLMFGPLLQRDMAIAQRLSTKTVTNAANMLPVLAEPVGLGRPVIPFFGRRGQAMGIDPFANPSGNYNGCVVATSGSGKTYVANELALRTVAAGGRAWIIDIGRGYEKSCKLVGGQYMEFRLDSGLSLNPFSMVVDIDADMELLKPLIAQMASPSKKLDDYELSQIEINIRQLWEEFGPSTTITMLAERLKRACYQGGSKEAFNDQEVDPDNCDPRIRDLGVQLFPFTEEGTYGRFFTGQANIEFTSDLIVLELEELNAMPALQSVVLLLVMYKITQEMYLGDRDRPRLTIIDEAWALLDGDASARFIEAGYRRARRYLGAFWTITQSINDYYKSSAATAAFENADWLWLLRQKKESIAALASSQKLVMDDATRKLIESVTTVGGRYSEVFIRCADLPPTIGRLFVDPFTNLLQSSKPEDFRAVKDLEARGLPVAEAIEQVLRGRGVRL